MWACNYTCHCHVRETTFNHLKIDLSFSCATLFLLLSKMDTLTDEILHICAQLSDKDNIHLSATSKRFSIIKFRILFFTQMYVKDIINLSYFHQFSDIIMSDTNGSLPKHTNRLTFNDHLNQSINGCIPESVTNLTFGYHFDQNIDELPISISNIELSINYKRKISKNMVPKVRIRK